MSYVNYCEPAYSHIKRPSGWFILISRALLILQANWLVLQRWVWRGTGDGGRGTGDGGRGTGKLLTLCFVFRASDSDSDPNDNHVGRFELWKSAQKLRKIESKKKNPDSFMLLKCMHFTSFFFFGSLRYVELKTKLSEGHLFLSS